jgi:hypothetical protein
MKRTFNYHQYVPVLRWKSSEREALCKLDSNLRKRITPIIELVPQDFEKGSTDSVLTKHASQIAKSWGWNDLFFIDFHLLGENRATYCVPIFINQADAYNLHAGLITGLNWSEAYQSAVKSALGKTGHEMCFRISAYELRQAGFQQAPNKLLVLFEKEPADIRGEGVKNENSAGFDQFPAQAQLLLERKEFSGAQFSDGDLYIHKMAQQFTKSGQLKDWLVATFNHHLTFVARQLDDFFAGSENNTPSHESNPSQHTLQA